MNEAEKIVSVLLEIDAKDLAMRSVQKLSPDTTIVFQCPFTREDETTAVPEYYSEDDGDWQREWSLANRYRLGDYIKDGVIDLNDLPFGCESVIVVNPDGSPGPEYTIEDLDGGTAQVIDTYVSPEIGRYGDGDYD
jgi:hypothetical protein